MADDVVPLGHHETPDFTGLRRKPLEVLGKEGIEGGTE